MSTIAHLQDTSSKNNCCQTGNCGNRCRCSSTALSRSIKQCLPNFMTAFFQPKSGSPGLQEKLQQLLSNSRNSSPRMS